MNNNRQRSYTSADTLPVKLLQQEEVYESIKNERIVPMLHPQLILTNKCNLKCRFCSCAKDDRNTEMPLEVVTNLLDSFRHVGAKAVTITGGGEPLLYPHFNWVIEELYSSGIDIGLVTNGLLLSTIDPIILEKIRWIRISHDSSRSFDLDYQITLSKAINSTDEVDWAFSYVVTKETVAENIDPIVFFANRHNFTHIRVVADLLNPDSVDMPAIENKLEDLVDDHKVIYQPRLHPERGQKECLIGLLKPLISADGKVYACCGVQYALKKPSKTLPIELCMGKAKDLKEIQRDGIDNPVDGRICARCYYGDYNRVLSALVSTVSHKDFV